MMEDSISQVGIQKKISELRRDIDSESRIINELTVRSNEIKKQIQGWVDHDSDQLMMF